jgi:hypothetical protein
MHGEMTSGKAIMGGNSKFSVMRELPFEFPSIFQTFFWRKQIVKVFLRAIRNFYVKKKRGVGEVDRFKGAFWKKFFAFFRDA